MLNNSDVILQQQRKRILIKKRNHVSGSDQMVVDDILRPHIASQRNQKSNPALRCNCFQCRWIHSSELRQRLLDELKTQVDVLKDALKQ